MNYLLLIIEELGIRLEKLPESLESAVNSPSNCEVVKQICRSNHLNDAEKILIVEQITTLVLLGFLTPDEVGGEISREIFIDNVTAKVIADEIKKKVFEPLIDDLKKNYRPIDDGSKPKIISTSEAATVTTESPKPGGEIQTRPFILSSTHQTAGPIGGDDKQGPHSSFGPPQRSSVSSVPDFHIQTRYSQAKIVPTTPAKDIELKVVLGSEPKTTQIQEQAPITQSKMTSAPLPTERSEAKVIMPVSGPKLEMSKPQPELTTFSPPPVSQAPISGPSKIIDQVQKLEKFGGELVEILNRRKEIEDKKLGIEKSPASIPAPVQPQTKTIPITPSGRPAETIPAPRDFSFQPPQPPTTSRQPIAAPVIIHQENQPAPIRASGSFKLQTLGQKSGDMIASSNKQTLPPIQKNFGGDIPSQGKPSGGWFRSLFGQKESNGKPATIVSFREGKQLKQETRRTLPPSPPLMRTVSLTNQVAPKIAPRPPMPKAPVAPKAAGADIVLKTSSTPLEKIIDLQTMKIKEIN